MAVRSSGVAGRITTGVCEMSGAFINSAARQPNAKVSGGSQPPLIFDLIPRPNGWLPSAAPVGPTVPSSPGRTRRKSDGRHLRVGPAVVDPDATWEYSKRVRQCGSGGPQ